MSKVIAIANQKGGVGKTTTTINLASSVAVAEIPVLIIDIDPQANATSGLGLSKENNSGSIYDVLINDRDIKETIQKTSMPFLDIIPSHINLAGAEVELVSMEDREKILLKAISSIRRKYQYIFIDCPPSLGLLTLNSLTAADTILIPVQTEYFALEGLSQLMNTYQLVKKGLNPALEIEGVLLTMFDARTNLSRQVAEEVRKYFGDKVYRNMILRNVRISEAPSFGKPLILYDAMSQGTENYLDLAREIMSRNNDKTFTKRIHNWNDNDKDKSFHKMMMAKKQQISVEDTI